VYDAVKVLSAMTTPNGTSPAAIEVRKNVGITRCRGVYKADATRKVGAMCTLHNRSPDCVCKRFLLKHDRRWADSILWGPLFGHCGAEQGGMLLIHSARQKSCPGSCCALTGLSFHLTQQLQQTALHTANV